MTGIQIASNALAVPYTILMFAIITGFAVYDIRKKRVPNKALVFSAPFFLLAPAISAFSLGDTAQFWTIFVRNLPVSFFGAAVGFSILLLAALLSTGGGMGGGDIKLSGLLGFTLGPYRIIGVLLVASALCILASLIPQFYHQSLYYVIVAPIVI